MVKMFSIQHIEGYRVSNLKLKFCVYLESVRYDEIIRRLKDLIDTYVSLIAVDARTQSSALALDVK